MITDGKEDDLMTNWSELSEKKIRDSVEKHLAAGYKLVRDVESDGVVFTAYIRKGRKHYQLAIDYSYLPNVVFTHEVKGA